MPSRKGTKGKSGPPKVRYGVVGLGYISQVAVLPAFQHARDCCELEALVSDDPVKLERLSAKYGAKVTAGYDGYDQLLRSGRIDAVYIALPNSMHAEFAVRAARAGVHVLCEKPMALTTEECQQMIDAAHAAGVRLMVAYRLHFERTNLEAVELARSGRLGELRYFQSSFSMQVNDADNIRLKRVLGGGPLWDLGVYCINAARYLFQEEPTHVLGELVRSTDPRFSEVEEMAIGLLRFPGGRRASFTCSFGAADLASYRLVGTEGQIRVDPAYEYAEGLKLTASIGGKAESRSFRKRDQFAAELIYFSRCIQEGTEPEPSGREGLADVRVVRAIIDSAREERWVALEPFEKQARPAMEQEIHRPGVKEPKLVHVTPPSGS